MSQIRTIILAGGKGTRMQSEIPKTLLPLLGVPILFRVLQEIKRSKLNDIHIVVGDRKEMIVDALRTSGLDNDLGIHTQLQIEGNGLAVKSALQEMDSNPTGIILIVFADDAGLFTSKVYEGLINTHTQQEACVSLLTIPGPIIENLGGLHIDDNGVHGVIRYPELVESGATVVHRLCGLLCFQEKWLRENVDKITRDPIKNEYLLTDLINMAVSQQERIAYYELADELLWNSINTPVELAEAEDKLRARHEK